MKILSKTFFWPLVILFYSCGGDDNGTPPEPNVVVIEFSANTSSSSEAIGDNLPVILILGEMMAQATISVSESVGAPNSAEGGGVDYTFDTPQTISIPIGIYDGTLDTAIPISTLSIIDDDIQEGTESFSLQMGNPTGDLQIGTINSFTYSIIDDES